MLAKSKYYQIQRHLSLSFSITLLTLIILTSVFYSKSNGLQSQQAESFLHYIHKNINTPPIISIKIDQKCPENYQKEPLFIWMGTLDGCYCENTLKMQNQCTPECQNIYQTTKRALFHWKSSLFCIKRSQTVQYGIQNCQKQNMKKCNPQICVESTEQCPITSIQKKLSEFQFYQENINQPLQDLTVWLDDFPCFNQEHNTVYYPLYNGINQPKILEKYSNQKPQRHLQGALGVYGGDQDCGVFGADSSDSFEVDQAEFLDFVKSSLMDKEFETQNLRIEEFIKYQKAILFGRKKLSFDYEKCSGFQNRMGEISIEEINNIGWGFLIVKIIVFLVVLAGEYLFYYVLLQENRLIIGRNALLLLANIPLIVEGYMVGNKWQLKEDIRGYFISFGKDKCFGNDKINFFLENLTDFYAEWQEKYASICLKSRLACIGIVCIILGCFVANILFFWNLRKKERLLQLRKKQKKLKKKKVQDIQMSVFN